MAGSCTSVGTSDFRHVIVCEAFPHPSTALTAQNVAFGHANAPKHTFITPIWASQSLKEQFWTVAYAKSL